MKMGAPFRWSCGPRPKPSLRLRLTRRGWFIVERWNMGCAILNGPAFDSWRDLLIGPYPSATTAIRAHADVVDRLRPLPKIAAPARVW